MDLILAELDCYTILAWRIACRRCSNYIFILDLIPGFYGLGKDKSKSKSKNFFIYSRYIVKQVTLAPNGR